LKTCNETSRDGAEEPKESRVTRVPCLREKILIDKWTLLLYLIPNRLEKTKMPAKTHMQRHSFLGILANQKQGERRRGESPVQESYKPNN